MIRILHIIDTISGAGPTRSLISLAKYAKEKGLEQEHRVIALKKEAYPISLLLAKQAGVDLLRNPDEDMIRQQMAGADIVQLHYWNNPAWNEFLRSDWPAARLLIWFKIFGKHPPQVITEDLLDYTDFALATSPDTLELPVFKEKLSEQNADFVYGLADWTRLRGVKPRPHESFNVGYIGTVNFTKMHPDYVAMSAGISIPNVKFVVCGGCIEDQLKKEAASLNASEKFDFRGYVENIGSVLEVLDVFGYPLCEDTYATSEKSIQEAMVAGVPPVVFPHGGCKDLVQHEKTGLIVKSEAEYREAIEYLYHNPQFRKELGQNAAEYAKKYFNGEKGVQKMDHIYKTMMNQPKRKRYWKGTGVSSRKLSPSEMFMESLGHQGKAFRVSLSSSEPDELQQAEKEIAESSPLLVGGEGGINQYRNYYPADPYLRLWSGLCLQKNGHHQKAIHEFKAGIQPGATEWRCYWYIAKSAHQIRDRELEKYAITRVKQELPNFVSAHDLIDKIS